MPPAGETVGGYTAAIFLTPSAHPSNTVVQTVLSLGVFTVIALLTYHNWLLLQGVVWPSLWALIVSLALWPIKKSIVDVMTGCYVRDWGCCRAGLFVCALSCSQAGGFLIRVRRLYRLAFTPVLQPVQTLIFVRGGLCGRMTARLLSQLSSVPIKLDSGTTATPVTSPLAAGGGMRRSTSKAAAAAAAGTPSMASPLPAPPSAPDSTHGSSAVEAGEASRSMRHLRRSRKASDVSYLASDGEASASEFEPCTPTLEGSRAQAAAASCSGGGAAGVEEAALHGLSMLASHVDGDHGDPLALPAAAPLQLHELSTLPLSPPAPGTAATSTGADAAAAVEGIPATAVLRNATISGGSASSVSGTGPLGGSSSSSSPALQPAPTQPPAPQSAARSAVSAHSAATATSHMSEGSFIHEAPRQRRRGGLGGAAAGGGDDDDEEDGILGTLQRASATFVWDSIQRSRRGAGVTASRLSMRSAGLPSAGGAGVRSRLASASHTQTQPHSATGGWRVGPAAARSTGGLLPSALRSHPLRSSASQALGGAHGGLAAVGWPPGLGGDADAGAGSSEPSSATRSLSFSGVHDSEPGLSPRRHPSTADAMSPAAGSGSGLGPYPGDAGAQDEEGADEPLDASGSRNMMARVFWTALLIGYIGHLVFLLWWPLMVAVAVVGSCYVVYSVARWCCRIRAVNALCRRTADALQLSRAIGLVGGGAGEAAARSQRGSNAGATGLDSSSGSSVSRSGADAAEAASAAEDAGAVSAASPCRTALSLLKASCLCAARALVRLVGYADLAVTGVRRGCMGIVMSNIHVIAASCVVLALLAGALLFTSFFLLQMAIEWRGLALSVRGKIVGIAEGASSDFRSGFVVNRSGAAGPGVALRYANSHFPGLPDVVDASLDWLGGRVPEPSRVLRDLWGMFKVYNTSLYAAEAAWAAAGQDQSHGAGEVASAASDATAHVDASQVVRLSVTGELLAAEEAAVPCPGGPCTPAVLHGCEGLTPGSEPSCSPSSLHPYVQQWVHGGDASQAAGTASPAAAATAIEGAGDGSATLHSDGQPPHDSAPASSPPSMPLLVAPLSDHFIGLRFSASGATSVPALHAGSDHTQPRGHHASGLGGARVVVQLPLEQQQATQDGSASPFSSHGTGDASPRLPSQSDWVAKVAELLRVTLPDYTASFISERFLAELLPPEEPTPHATGDASARSPPDARPHVIAGLDTDGEEEPDADASAEGDWGEQEQDGSADEHSSSAGFANESRRRSAAGDGTFGQLVPHGQGVPTGMDDHPQPTTPLRRPSVGGQLRTALQPLIVALGLEETAISLLGPLPPPGPVPGVSSSQQAVQGGIFSWAGAFTPRPGSGSAVPGSGPRGSNATGPPLYELVGSVVGNFWNFSAPHWTFLATQVHLLMPSAGTLRSAWQVLLSAGMMLFSASASVISVLVSALLFLSLLFYLLAAQTSWLDTLLAFHPAAEWQARVRSALSATVQQLFSINLKVVLYHALFTYLVLTWCGVRLVYTWTAVHAVTAALPLLPVWLINLVPALELAAGREWLTAAAVLVLHSGWLSYADWYVQEELRYGHPVILGLSIIAGLAVYGLQGAIIGPLLVTVTIASYILLGEALSGSGAASQGAPGGEGAGGAADVPLGQSGGAAAAAPASEAAQGRAADRRAAGASESGLGFGAASGAPRPGPITASAAEAGGAAAFAGSRRGVVNMSDLGPPAAVLFSPQPQALFMGGSRQAQQVHLQQPQHRSQQQQQQVGAGASARRAHGASHTAPFSGAGGAGASRRSLGGSPGSVGVGPYSAARHAAGQPAAAWPAAAHEHEYEAYPAPLQGEGTAQGVRPPYHPRAAAAAGGGAPHSGGFVAVPALSFLSRATPLGRGTMGRLSEEGASGERDSSLASSPRTAATSASGAAAHTPSSGVQGGSRYSSGGVVASAAASTATASSSSQNDSATHQAASDGAAAGDDVDNLSTFRVLEGEGEGQRADEGSAPRWRDSRGGDADRSAGAAEGRAEVGRSASSASAGSGRSSSFRYGDTPAPPPSSLSAALSAEEAAEGEAGRGVASHLRAARGPVQSVVFHAGPLPASPSSVRSVSSFAGEIGFGPAAAAARPLSTAAPHPPAAKAAASTPADRPGAARGREGALPAPGHAGTPAAAAASLHAGRTPYRSGQPAASPDERGADADASRTSESRERGEGEAEATVSAAAPSTVASLPAAPAAPSASAQQHPARRASQGGRRQNSVTWQDQM